VAFLAIETSQHIGGVALRLDSGDADVEMLHPQSRHDDDLLPAIDRLCARHGVAPAALGAIGVSVGPGGFTGLRIAISTAKMLAEVTGAELIAVPSALVAAESSLGGGDSSDAVRSAVVALAAKDDTFWSTRLRRSGAPDAWIIEAKGAIVAEGQLDLRGIAAFVADEHLPAWAAAACGAAGVRLVAPRFDPRACLGAAELMRARGEVTDPLRLLPLYPRVPEAVSIWERRQAERLR
jgi:tRNA threonylcarbamoyl adenosine modification protein YeaZ